MKCLRFCTLTATALFMMLLLVGCSQTPSVPITVNGQADFSGLDVGVIDVTLEASQAAPVTVKAEHVRKDGSVVNTWSKSVDLQPGANALTLEVGNEHAAVYGDRIALSYTYGRKQTEFASVVPDSDLITKLDSYIDSMTGTAEPTGIDKSYYVRVIARCLAEYHRINDLRTATVEGLDSTLQSYSRVLSSMAVLVDYGAQNDLSALAEEFKMDLYADYDALKALFDRMMATGCAAAIDYAGEDVENFAVLELAIAYYLARDHFPAASVAVWEASLSQVKPNSVFFSHALRDTNRNVSVMAGEQMRAYLGLVDQTAVNTLIDRSLSRQFSHFDANGMYRDNFGAAKELNPALYDLSTRARLQTVLSYGYEGEAAQELDELLRKGSLMTLFTTSANGELSYGGRSNQYLHNAAVISAYCEYEASRYAALDDIATAGAYKRTAHRAIASVPDFLAANKHIMNYYTDASVGTEAYGNYDKYMVTMSAWLSVAYIFADDTIAEGPAPMEVGGYVVETSDLFGSLCANAGGYSIQILTDADPAYDSVGLGRIHKDGVYSALGLSMSMTETPGYILPGGTNKKSISLCPRWWSGTEEYCMASFTDMKHTLTVLREEPEVVEFILRYEGDFQGISTIEEHYTLTAEGLTVTVTVFDPTEDKVGYLVPLLVTNGDSEAGGTTEIQTTENGFTVSLNGQTYIVTSDADTVTRGDVSYGNRNGAYCTGLLEKAGNTITLHFRFQ